MPSTTSSSVSSDFASSTVITPSLPTFSIAWAMKSPMSRSPLAEIVPTWAISCEVLTFFERFWMSPTTAATAMSTPRLRSIGFIPAATALEPSRTIDWASTVAVVVPSPAMSEVLVPHLAQHLRTHVLELVGKLDLFRHRHPVLGDARRAERLVEDDVAALGAERHPDRVGQDIDPAQHLGAGVRGQT